MSEYVLFLPTSETAEPAVNTQNAVRESVDERSAAFDAGTTDDLIAQRAFENAALTVRLSEVAGIDRVSADAQAYLQRLEDSTASTMGAAQVLTEAAAAARDRPDVTTFGTLGAVAVESLSAEEVARLRAAGFDVVPNVRTYAGPIEPAITTDDTPWPIVRCGIDRVHDAGFTGQGKRIGIMDTGIDASHPEFRGKSVEFAEFDHMGRLVGTTPRDSGNHGTHVSAIAAGRTVGVAKGADLAVAAVLTQVSPLGNYGDLPQIIAGLEWLISVAATGAASSEVCVVNASLGGRGYNDYLLAPIRRARALGLPFVASIGNAGAGGRNRHGSPGNYGIAIGVGASDFADQVASFSDWGNVAQEEDAAKPNLCAPGVAIRSAVPGGGYSSMSGTSMAAPFVAGAVALLIQQHPELKSNVSALEDLLYGNVTKLSDHRGGLGRLLL